MAPPHFSKTFSACLQADRMSEPLRVLTLAALEGQSDDLLDFFVLTLMKVQSLF